MKSSIRWVLIASLSLLSQFALSLDTGSTFRCGQTLTRAVITSTNFFESGENLLVFPGLRGGQRGFYSLATNAVKYHPLPPERAFKKNDKFYYHLFALEDPKTKKQAHIVYSDFIAAPEDAITMTMGEKDKRAFPLSIGVQADDTVTRAALMERYKLSIATIPQIIKIHEQNDRRAPESLKRDIVNELSQIVCACRGVVELRAELAILSKSPGVAPYASNLGCRPSV